MTRTKFGPGAVTFPTVDDGDLGPYVGSLTVWTAETGGTQLTDLQTVTGTSITQLTVGNGAIDGATGRFEFFGPDPYSADVWVEPTISGTPGPRWQVLPQDIATRTGGVSSVSLNGGAPQTGAVSLTSLTSVASTDITDSGATGQALIRANSQSAAQAAIGISPSSGIPLSTVTTKGDLIVGTASATVSRLPAGTTGQVVSYDPTTATGLKAVTPAATPDLTPYATKAGTTRQFSDVSTTTPVGGYVSIYDGTTQKWSPIDPTTQFAGVDGAGRLLPQNRPKYDLDLVVINQGDPIPADVQAGALVFQRPATVSLVPQLEAATFTSTSTGTSLTWTNTDAIAAGDWVGFGVMTSGETTTGVLPTVISSITPATGAYSSIVSGPESVQSGTVQVDLKYAKCSTAIPAGTTHTMTLNQNRAHRAVIMFKLPGIAATAPLDQSTNSQGGSQTTLDLSVGPTGNMALTPQIGILVTGHNDGSAPVTRVVSGTNGWALLASVESETAATSRTLNVLYKTYANASATPLQGTVHITASDSATGAYTMAVASFKSA